MEAPIYGLLVGVITSVWFFDCHVKTVLNDSFYYARRR